MEIEIAEIITKHKLPILRSDDLDYDKELKTVFEIWRGAKKLSIYFYETETTLLRVWGPHIHDEMSEHDLTKATDVQSHIEWLIGG